MLKLNSQHARYYKHRNKLTKEELKAYISAYNELEPVVTKAWPIFMYELLIESVVKRGEFLDILVKKKLYKGERFSILQTLTGVRLLSPKFETLIKYQRIIKLWRKF